MNLGATAHAANTEVYPSASFGRLTKTNKNKTKMEFRFEGYIREIGPLEAVTFKNNTVHNKREIIVSTDEEYPNSMAIGFWDDDAKALSEATQRQYISVDFKCKADIIKTKDGVAFFKNTIKGWRFVLGTVNFNLRWHDQQPPQQQPAPAQQVAPPQQAAPAQQVAPQQAAPQQVALNVNGLPNPVMLNPPF